MLFLLHDPLPANSFACDPASASPLRRPPSWVSDRQRNLRQSCSSRAGMRADLSAKPIPC